MLTQRREEFEGKIEPLMKSDGLPEPIIRFSRELYVETGIVEKTIAILKVLQGKVIIRDNPEEVKEIEALDGMLRDIIKWKTFAFSHEIEGKTSEQIEKSATIVFDSYTKYRVANAIFTLERNQEAVDLLKDVDTATLDKLMELSVEVAEDLKKERDNKLIEERE